MKRTRYAVLIAMALTLIFNGQALAAGLAFWKKGAPELKPVKQQVEIPLSSISDGKAHHFKVRASDGLMVTFFTLMSKDGVIRSAIDACDVCYRSGKGYKQDGDFMVCGNCGQRFASHKINEIRGGCNPAPLKREIVGDNLVIAMADIDTNSWYMKWRQ